MCHHMATAARVATKRDVSGENSVRRIRRGAQAHSSLFHADERVRETAPGVEYLAESVWPLKSKAGEIEGWPGTLNRMDCCITSVPGGVRLSVRKGSRKATLYVAADTNVGSKRA